MKAKRKNDVVSILSCFKTAMSVFVPMVVFIAAMDSFSGYIRNPPEIDLKWLALILSGSMVGLWGTKLSREGDKEAWLKATLGGLALYIMLFMWAIPEFSKNLFGK